MEAASLNLPTTAAQANAFMTAMPESKDNVIKQEKDIKAEAQDESASGIVPTLQYVKTPFLFYFLAMFSLTR
jgi:hypothetical protein